MTRPLGKGLFVFLCLYSVGGIYSYGLYTSPGLLPILWVAARRAARWERGFWIYLSGGCAFIAGALSASTFGLDEYSGGLVATCLVSMSFVATTSPTADLRGGDHRLAQ